MAQKQPQRMGRYRAIMTDTDRSYISGEGDASENQRLQSVSRVRNRITKELPQDIDILEQHRPDLVNQLRDVVCEDHAADGGEDQGGDLDAIRDDLERALEYQEWAAVEDALARLENDV